MAYKCLHYQNPIHHSIIWIIHDQILAPFVSLLTISSTFDLLFKVLFTFPSLYFFAIGLPEIFSFGWDLPPFLGCNPKQPDSSKDQHVLKQIECNIRDSHPLWCLVPKNLCTLFIPVMTIRKTTIREIKKRPPDFKFELCPLHSPLLRTS